MRPLLPLSLALVACASSGSVRAPPEVPSSGLARSEIEPVGGRIDEFGAILSFHQQTQKLDGSVEKYAEALRTIAYAVDQMGDRSDASLIRGVADRIATAPEGSLQGTKSLERALTVALAAADDIALSAGRTAPGLADAYSLTRSLDGKLPLAAQRPLVDASFRRVAEVYVDMIRGR